MGKYSCPVCDEDVAPVSLGRITDGRIVGPTPEGLLLEKKRCPACGEPLERLTAEHWHVEGSRQLEPVAAGFR